MMMSMMCLLLSGLPPAEAAQLEFLKADADVVVRGVVKTSHSRWTRDGSNIVTQIEVEVRENLKGSPGGSTVTLLHQGGRVEDVEQKVSGVLMPQVNEEVILFLERRPAGFYRVKENALAYWKVNGAFATHELIQVPLSFFRAPIPSAPGSSVQTSVMP